MKANLSGSSVLVYFLGKHSEDFQPRDKEGEFDRLLFILIIRMVTRIFWFIKCIKILPLCENFHLLKHEESIAANPCRKNAVLS